MKPLPGKLMGMSMHCDNLSGAPFEQGLADLDTVVMATTSAAR